MFRSLVIALCLFAMICTSSCWRERERASRYEKKLFAPLTGRDIDLLVHDCGSRKELLNRCGTPLRITESNGVESIEFMVSFDKVQEPTSLTIASFVVTVSNDTVLSWYPRSKGRIR